jgi:hypothetical protein
MFFPLTTYLFATNTLHGKKGNFRMPVWETTPLNEQPDVTLRNWQVLEAPNGERHLIGYCVENLEGRVSSAVEHINADSLLAQTRSGRRYQLGGRPGHNSDAEYVWRTYMSVNGITAFTDVTATVWQAHLTAAAAPVAGKTSKEI